MLMSGAGWLPFAAFVAACLGALGVFSNRVWKHPRYMRRPLDSAVALVGNAALLAFPVILMLDGAGRTRCLVALVVHVVVGLLMTPPPYWAPNRRRRGPGASGEDTPSSNGP
jgi:hypothetical protein